MQLKIHFLCRDSILAAPIVLDTALFMDLAKRAGMSGIQEWLSFYFKAPMHAPSVYPEHDLFIQPMKLKNTLRHMMGEELITHLGREGRRLAKPPSRCSRPAALGGLFIGILSALPIVGAANCCCCLWIVARVALFPLISAGLNQPASLTPGEGAIVGGLAGLIGAFVWIPVALVMDLLMSPLQQAVVGSILSNARDLPPEAREVLEGLGQPSSPFRYVFGFMLMFFGGGGNHLVRAGDSRSR